MYDILQLNDMILPELREIADKLRIKGFEKLEKQDLILKVLDAQALNPEVQEDAHKARDKGKRPRTRKPIGQELKPKKDKEEEEEEKEPAAEEEVYEKRTHEANAEQHFAKTDDRQFVSETEVSQGNSGNGNGNGNSNGNTEPTEEKPREDFRNKNIFSVESDAIIEGEGVLEMMPDGYGFLRSSDYNYLTSPTIFMYLNRR